MLVIVGMRTGAHFLRSQVGIGSESDCLLGQLKGTLEISDSETGLKVDRVGAVVNGEGECGDTEVDVSAKERRSLDILSVKKEARLSASVLVEVEEGKGDGDLRCNNLFIVCKRRLGFPTDEVTRLE